jgi:ABC-type glycerol-3-phosphate transport system substrate-binding protein
MVDTSDALISRRQALKGVGGVMAVGMLGGVLGCGGGSSGSDATTIEAWSYRPEYRQAIEKIVSAFEKDNAKVSVDMAYKPVAQYATVLQTALVGGSAPDAIATSGANGIWGDTGADGGYIAPLDGRFPTAPISPKIRSAITYKGHVYGAPVQTFRIGIYYQRGIFQEHGLSAPKTWNDVIATSKKLKDAGETAWSMPAQDITIPFFLYHLAVNSILQAESETALASGKRKLTDADLVPAAKLLVDLEPYYNKGYQAVAYAEGKALFAQGRAAMIVGGSSDYAGYAEVNPKIDVGFFGFPSPDGTQPATALNGLSMAYTVNKKSKQQAAAIAFVSWLTSESAQRLVLQELGLPARRGIEPTGDDPRSVVLGTILSTPDSPSWLDYPPTGNMLTDMLKWGGGIFTGKLSPQQFAAKAQQTVKTSGSA